MGKRWNWRASNSSGPLPALYKFFNAKDITKQDKGLALLAALKEVWFICLSASVSAHYTRSSEKQIPILCEAIWLDEECDRNA